MKVSSRCRLFIFGVILSYVLNFASSAQAQDWFRQRTVGSESSPIGPISLKGLDVNVSYASRTVSEATQVFTATGLPANIPDYPSAGITSTIALPAQTNWTGLRVSVNITHTYRGDLLVRLTSPSGTRFTLSDQEGGSDRDIVITDQSLGVTAGSSLQGNWVLSIVDLGPVDTGRLNSWSLAVVSPATYALIDLTVALESNPTGDNNGNTQNNVGSEQQDKWEHIIQYFADAVFEMTNGAHRIREVRAFRNSKNFNAADIRWNKAVKGRPHVDSGVGVAGGHVEMYEVFGNGEGGVSDKDMLADEIGSGYTMAHEWGHFYLGLYDEYNPACGTTTVSVAPSIMSNQWRAKGDLRWLNFSILRQQGGDFQDTLLNCQNYAYGTGAWPLLSRPVSADPTDQASRSWQTLGSRIYYPELTVAAPSGSATPRIDLPSTNARSSLNIIWMGDRQNIDIVLDNSGSMAGDKLAQAKTAAKLLVDQAVLNENRIGVTVFSDGVTNLVALTLISSETIRSQIKAAIDGIGLGGGTAIGDAAASSLAKLQAINTTGENKVVFLLTDGQSNTGRDPLSVIPAYAAAHIPIFAFGFGSDADSAVLSQMASGTGGRYFFSPTTLGQISAAFQAANQTASSNPGLGVGSLISSSSSPASVQLPVDSSLGRFQISVVYSGTAPAGGLRLLNPSGQQISPTSTSTVGSETLLFFDVAQPAGGAWQLTSSSSASGITFSYSVSGVQTSVGYDVSTGLRSSDLNVTTPGPVIIESRLSHRLPIAGATLAARITNPAGTTSAIQLLDGGVYPDMISGDGVYTGLLQPSGRGQYSLVVQFSNPNLSARETYRGSTASPSTTGGLVPVPTDVTVTENFSRSQTLQFSIDTSIAQLAPSITTQPASQSSLEGGSISFSVTALATPAASYQWRRKGAGAATFITLVNGGNYSGVATDTLVVSGLTLAMSGDQFQCVITNSAGSATTTTATLTVLVGNFISFSFADRGGRSSVSSGTSPSLTVGYAAIHPGAGSTTPSGMAIFGVRRNNVLVSEAAVPASPLIQSGRIYAEVNGAVNTGIAIANPNDQAAVISFHFANANGDIFGSGTTVIDAAGKVAAFLSESPFNSGLLTGGTFTFVSSVPVSVIALRGLNNERSEFLITTLPVADLGVAATSDSLVFPQYADGSGWTTQIMLVNRGDTTLTGAVQFLNNLGAAAVVTVNGQASSSFAYSIPPRTSRKFQTSGFSSPLLSGSVRVLPGGNTPAPSGLAVFSFRERGITVSEAGVPSVQAGGAFRLYAEAAGNFGSPGSIQTGIAIANNSSTTANVTLELTRLDGSFTGLIGTLTVPANGQTSTFLNQVSGLSSLPLPFQGVLRVSSPASISVIGLRGRYNERSEFLITTTFPINEAGAPSTSPLYFPHIADGEGYTTQFILFSGRSGQSSSGTMQLLSPSGGAWTGSVQ